MSAVLAAASSFEARSRNNSLEGAENVKNVRTSSFDAGNGAKNVDGAKTTTVIAKKEKAVPPPRKSSDPANKVLSPPKASPPEGAKELAPKTSPPVQISSKVKVSNGTLPQSIQNQAAKNTPVPKAVQAPHSVQTAQNNRVQQNVQTPQNQIVQNSRGLQNNQSGQSKTPQKVQAPQSFSAPQQVQTAVTPAPEPIKPKEETQKADAGESNGVGDKIRKFERAAEDATAGRTSRPGSVRGRVRSESQEKNSGSNPSLPDSVIDKTTKDDKQVFSPTAFTKWRKEDPPTPIPALKNPPKAEEKETKPTIKFNKFPTDLPVSASVGARAFDRQLSATLPSEVSSPTQPSHVHRIRKEQEDDPNAQFKTCKFKPKERYSGKPSGYFSRGTEEIWMVKKKDIEEIEDRVMESFRRAGSSCRSEPIREFPTFTVGSATLGRSKRAMYARSESLDPQYAASRSQTLKRQSSVACTCGHDKKNRAKSGGASTPVECGPPRPRSRSHGDDHSQGHVLDKYETLV